MKKALSIILLHLCSLYSFGQVIQEYIGTTGFKGFANSSATLSGGETVVVGVSTGLPGDSEGFITCMDAAGNILWSREVGTPKNDRFIGVTATSDGGCVAVGYVASDLSNPFLNSQAAVYKFDNTGSVIWSKIIEATSYGEAFHSVFEVPGSNNIVCGGVLSLGSSSSGMLINFTSSGLINWSKIYTASEQTIIDIKYLSGNIVCAGLFRQGGGRDGRIFSVKEADGTVNWNRTFNYASSYNPSISDNYFDRINIVQDKIYVDAFIAPNSGAPSIGAAITPSLLEVDTTGLSPFCLEYPFGPGPFANVIHSKVVSKNEIYLFQHTSANHWDKIYATSPITNVTDVVCTKIKDITNAGGSLVYVRKLGNTGEQGITHTRLVGGKIIGWGGANNDPANLNGTQDIFKLEADTALPVTATSCAINASGQNFAYPTVTINSTATFSSINTVTLLTPVVPTVNNVTYSKRFPCKVAMIPNFNFTRTGCFTFDFKDLSLKGSSGIKFWQWDFGDGSISGAQHPSHTYSTFGSYAVKLVVTDSMGNKDSITKTVTLSPYRFLYAGNDTAICSTAIPATVPLTAKGGKTFSWSPVSGLSDPAIANPVATVIAPIVYVVTATDSLGCVNKDSTIITIRTTTVKVTPDSARVCPDETILLSASGAVKYRWSPDEGLNTDTGTAITARITSATTYTVTGTDMYGCTAVDSVKIALLPPATVRALQDTVGFCRGTDIWLEASDAIRYKWYTNETDYDTAATIPIKPEFSTYIKVKGWNAEGCFAIDSVYLSERPATKVNITTDNPKVGCGTSAILEATGAQSYTWWPSEYTSNSSGTAVTVFPPHTMYMYVQGTDSLGCKGADSILVNFDGKSLALIPSAFTPDNDGVNDKIKPIIICNFTVSEFAIYNRWGQQVFSGNSNNSSWDGSQNGSPCSTGVYYYFLKGKKQDNTEILMKGDITLIR